MKQISDKLINYVNKRKKHWHQLSVNASTLTERKILNV